MTEHELRNDYYGWLVGMVGKESGGRDPKLYFQLLWRLFSLDYIYVLPMDGNRAEDGIDLRYRFGHETGTDPAVIASMLDVRPCSILEMIVALAVRCDDDIMWSPEIGSRTGKWFWGMIDNLGLGHMSGGMYDEEAVDRAVFIFLERKYARNGKGGLFVVKNDGIDMRKTEIWYQMHHWLSEMIETEKET